MKQNLFFLLSGLLLFSPTNLLAQCCPYILSVSTVPQNPAADDSVKIVIEVSTPNQGSKIMKQHYLQNDSLFLEACYYSGFLTQPQAYADTFEAGILNAGSYVIHLTAIQSSEPGNCDYSDKQVLTTELIVGGVSGIFQPAQDDIFIYPNPFTDVISMKGIVPVDRIRIMDLQGRALVYYNIPSPKNTSIDLQFLPGGNYLLEMWLANGIAVRRMICKM